MKRREKPLPMKRILSLPALAAFALLSASCSQQVRPVKKTSGLPCTWGRWSRCTPATTMCSLRWPGTFTSPEPCSSPSLRAGRKPQGREPDRDGGTYGPGAHSGGHTQRSRGGRGPGVPVPEPGRSGKLRKKDNPDPDNPEPGTDEDGKEVTPPISPDGGKTPDGLLPVPGEAPAPDPADQERISREREKILRELESVPGKLDDPWREAFSGKSAGK